MNMDKIGLSLFLGAVNFGEGKNKFVVIKF